MIYPKGGRRTPTIRFQEGLRTTGSISYWIGVESGAIKSARVKGETHGPSYPSIKGLKIQQVQAPFRILRFPVTSLAVAGRAIPSA